MGRKKNLEWADPSLREVKTPINVQGQAYQNQQHLRRRKKKKKREHIGGGRKPHLKGKKKSRGKDGELPRGGSSAEGGRGFFREDRKTSKSLRKEQR